MLVKKLGPYREFVKELRPDGEPSVYCECRLAQDILREATGEILFPELDGDDIISLLEEAVQYAKSGLQHYDEYEFAHALLDFHYGIEICVFATNCYFPDFYEEKLRSMRSSLEKGRTVADLEMYYHEDELEEGLQALEKAISNITNSLVFTRETKQELLSYVDRYKERVLRSMREI